MSAPEPDPVTAPVPPPAVRAAADLRLLRAAVFTAVCVVVSAAGHLLGSCAGVPLWTLGAGCAVVFAIAAPLAGRERSLPGIAVALAVGQVALHTLFGLGQHRAAVAAVPPQGAGPLSDREAIGLARGLTCGLDGVRMDGAEARRILHASGIHPLPDADAASAAHQAPSLLHGLLPSLPMLLGHLLAALTAGWLLRRGEAALWRLVRLSAPAAREMEVAAGALVRALCRAFVLVRALCSGLFAAPERPARAPDSYGKGKAGPREPALQHSVVRRGPPALALAA